MVDSLIDIKAQKNDVTLDATVQNLFEITPTPTALSSPNGRLEYVNPAFNQLLGYKGNEIFSSEVTITHPGDIEVNRKIRESLLKNPFTPIQIEKRYLHKQGHTVYGMLMMVAQPDGDGNVVRYIAQVVDLSTIKQADANEILLNHLFEKSGDGIYVIDPEFGQILNCNALGHNVLGYSKDEILKLTVSDISPTFADSSQWQQITIDLIDKETAVLELKHERKDGAQFHVEVSLTMTLFHRKYYVLAVARDITQRKLKEDEHIRLSHIDPLTNLANRRKLDTLLRNKVIAARENNNLIAFVYCDMDDFKPINDKYGHKFGDLVLVAVAKRLKQCFRQSDTVARIGGDEFLAVVDDIKDKQDVVNISDKVMQTFCSPFSIEGQELTINISVGISLFPDNGNDLASLIDLADKAMYQSKQWVGTKITQAKAIAETKS